MMARKGVGYKWEQVEKDEDFNKLIRKVFPVMTASEQAALLDKVGVVSAVKD